MASLQRLKQNCNGFGETHRHRKVATLLKILTGLRALFGASQPLFNLFEGLRNVALCGSSIHFPLPLPSLQLPRMRTHRPPTDRPLFVISSPTSDAANANVPHAPFANQLGPSPSLSFHFVVPARETRILVCGGASANDAILQVISDIFNAPVFTKVRTTSVPC